MSIHVHLSWFSCLVKTSHAPSHLQLVTCSPIVFALSLPAFKDMTTAGTLMDVSVCLVTVVSLFLVVLSFYQVNMKTPGNFTSCSLWTVLRAIRFMWILLLRKKTTETFCQRLYWRLFLRLFTFSSIKSTHLNFHSGVCFWVLTLSLTPTKKKKYNFLIQTLFSNTGRKKDIKIRRYP